MGLSAGYGLQLLNVFQNLSQLKELWPNGFETFLANSGFQVYFAPRDKTMGEDEALIFGQNIGLIRPGRRPYYLSPEFKRCYDPDPYEIGRQEQKRRGLWEAIFR